MKKPVIASANGVVDFFEDIVPKREELQCAGRVQLLKVMQLLESLELCFSLKSPKKYECSAMPPTGIDPNEMDNFDLRYLFPCLLKPVGQEILDAWWPIRQQRLMKILSVSYSHFDSLQR